VAPFLLSLLDDGINANEADVDEEVPMPTTREEVPSFGGDGLERWK
jgi:hypothetical protein